MKILFHFIKNLNILFYISTQQYNFHLRKVPIINFLIFRTKIFDFFAWGATQYNTMWWYNLHGKKYVKKIIYETWYGNEFRELWERTGGKAK